MPSEDEVVFSESQRGVKCALFAGRRFTKRKGRRQLTCCNKKCSAKITLQDSTVVEEEGCHIEGCLPWGEEKLQRHSLITSVKRKATENRDAPPIKLVRRELRGCEHDLLTVNDIRRATDCVGYHRRKQYSCIPRSKDDVLCTLREKEDDILTERGEKFCFVGETDIVLYTTAENLRMLSECKIFLADGTFEHCPQHFKQLYVVHGMKDGHYMRLAYAALSDKKPETYMKLWSRLKDLAVELAGRNLDPSEVLVDFEPAAHKALRAAFPKATITGCRFHLGQCFIKHIREGGLREEYAQGDTDEGKWLRAWRGLSLLPPEMVDDGWLALMEEAPTGTKYTKFSDYVLDTYVKSNARFPVQMWARAPSSDPRTTNSAEGFHRHFNSQFTGSHPNIFVLQETLLDIQVSTYITMRTIQMKIPAKVDNRTIRKREMVQEAWRDLESGNCTLYKYLVRVGVLHTAKY